MVCGAGDVGVSGTFITAEQHLKVVDRLKAELELLKGERDAIDEAMKGEGDMSELLSDSLELLAMLPDYDDVVWQDLRSATPWSDLDGVRCDIAFAKNGLRNEVARLSEIERYTDYVSADWAKRCQQLEDERDRLLVLAAKYCDKNHHDWQEILRIAGDA